MRLVLPDGWRHVIDIEADLNTTCCHVVQDDGVRRKPGEGRLPPRQARTLCGLEITLGGDPLRYGTMTVPEGDRLAFYPGTCGSCAYHLASWMVDVDKLPDINDGGGPTREQVIRGAWNDRGEWAPSASTRSG